MKKHFNLIVTVIVLLLLAVWGIRSYMHKTYPPKMGFNAATLLNADDNKPITVNDYLGNVVIVSCFQTWCRDCARETPVLNELATRLNTEPFKVIYITDERNDKLIRFRRNLASDKIIFTYATKSLASLGIYVYPTTFLLNKKGEVVQTKLEGYDWLLEEKTIRKLLAE